MAAGTAVMHVPSPRNTVKKEEPTRRVQKIKQDVVGSRRLGIEPRLEMFLLFEH